MVLLLAATAFGQMQTQPLTHSADWIPQVIQQLAQASSSHTDFTFDHSMLVVAAKVDSADDSLRRVVAGVDGVSVHRFRFQNGVSYDPGILNLVRQQYHAAGWEHLASGHSKGESGETDLWFHFENNAIRRMAFMVVGRDHINFVTISGSISPIDLLHLAGHFGIPEMEGGLKIPNSVAQAPVPSPEQ
jgi:hypothetical protein